MREWTSYIKVGYLFRSPSLLSKELRTFAAIIMVIVIMILVADVIIGIIILMFSTVAYV